MRQNLGSTNTHVLVAAAQDVVHEVQNGISRRWMIISACLEQTAHTSSAWPFRAGAVRGRLGRYLEELDTNLSESCIGQDRGVKYAMQYTHAYDLMHRATSRCWRRQLQLVRQKKRIHRT